MADPQKRVPVILSKRLVLQAITVPGVVDVVARLMSTDITIFMLHRFAVPEFGLTGHDPKTLRRVLAELRKRRYNLIQLDELLRRLREGEALKRAVVFTIDDGYFDQGRIAGPIFGEFDCPVTFFVVTGFLDGSVWLWWDKIAYVFKHTKRRDVSVRLGPEIFHFVFDSDNARANWVPFVERCEYASETDRQACIADLSVQCDVEIPEVSPPQFAALTWDEARNLEKGGMTFAPHTLTHPILSTTTDLQSEREISESWKRLSTQVTRPVPVFCYPGGRLESFGTREISTIQRSGLLGAVSAEMANMDPRKLQNGSEEWYRVPRRAYPDNVVDVLQCVSGLETLKSRVRRRTSAPQP